MKNIYMKKRQKAIIIFLVVVVAVLSVTLALVKRQRIQEDATRAYVYLLLYDEETQMSSLEPFLREIPFSRSVEKKILFTFEQLAAAVGEEEEKRGITTSFPESVLPLNVWTEGRTVYIDFPKSIDEGGGTLMMESRLAQIVFTATQFPGVDAVKLIIEGEEVSYFSGEGLTQVEKPMSRQDFHDFN